VVVKQIYGKDRTTCPACKWAHFEDPKVAATVVVERDKKFLLVRRLYNPHRGLWSLPGGYIDAKEDPASAARRECLEETNLEVEITGLLEVITGREHPYGADIVLIYSGKVIGGKLSAGDDATQAAFFDCDHLPDLAFKSTLKIFKKCKDVL
jgi:8-oxo-dGTP diphosphatase